MPLRTRIPRFALSWRFRLTGCLALALLMAQPSFGQGRGARGRSQGTTWGRRHALAAAPRPAETERAELLELARQSLEEGRRAEDPRGELLKCSTLLEARLVPPRPVEFEQMRLRRRLARFDKGLDRSAEQAHSEALCRAAEQARERAEKYVGQKRWADADLAMSAAELLYRRAFVVDKMVADAPREADLEELERRVQALRGKRRPPDLLAGIDVDLALAREALAHGHRGIALLSVERIQQALARIGAGAGIPEAELARLDELLVQAAPISELSTRHRELFERASGHRSRALRRLQEGQKRRAIQEINDGKRLALRLIEEAPKRDASTALQRVDELLVVARERCAKGPERAIGLLENAEALRQKAGKAQDRGEMVQAEEQAARAEDLLFEVLALTR